MPRPKRDGAPEPKKRSRNGCWPCKARKVKCGEERPRCLNCERQGEPCDYSIRLNWGGRSRKGQTGQTDIPSARSPAGNSLSAFFPTPEALIGSPTPSATYSEPDFRSRRRQAHIRSRSNLSLPPGDVSDRELSPYPASPGPTSAPASAGFASELGEHGMLPLAALQRPQLRREVTSNPVDPRIGSLGVRASPTHPSTGSPSLPAPDLAQHTPPPNTLKYGYSHDTLLPPFRTIGSASPRGSTPERASAEVCAGGERQAKRMRFSPDIDTSIPPFAAPSLPRQLHSFEHAPTNFPNPGLTFSFVPTPLTPGSNTVEEIAPGQVPPSQNAVPEEPRRLSVNDLLSAPPEDVFTPQTPDSWPMPEVDTKPYGYDLGKPDEDVPRNNDRDAIKSISSPEAKRLVFPPGAFTVGGCGDEGDGEKSTPQAFTKGGYYAKPVAIRIPRALEPLPARLLQNPMNLLYFHHFLNHTARILVPHDCEQNPFRNILPQMAVQDDNILNLMLAYSASHRARLLQHHEPGNRIAEYVQDVFPKLRKALMSPAHQVSAADLGSAIMLASLEILSPNTFDVPITWQNHLHIAREMIIARGGPQSVHKRDKVAYFLSRWFAYLDVLGSLSGCGNDWPLSSSYWNSEDDMEDEFQIDCLLGFTSRCVGILARISELAKECERDRLQHDGQVNPHWRPPGDVVKQAENLKRELQQSRGHVTRSCSHRRPSTPSHPISEPELAWDSLEIYATNEAFHWAGLIHLTRRVLGRPSSDPEVQNAVREIVGALYKVRRGSTAEACLLFPMFTAGCDALDGVQRDKIMERLKGVEGFGMHQVNKARKLMEKVWESGKPWECLVEGEFFG